MSRSHARHDAVVFDLDGTLVDSYRAIAASLAAARAAFDLPPVPLEEVRASVGHGLEELIAHWIGADRVDDGVRHFREHYATVYETGTSALPGAREALERLRASGLRLAVASNKPERFSTPILRALDMHRFMTHVAGPDTAGRTKPDPAMLRECLDALGSEAGRTLYVGDMPLDVDSGDRAGLPVALVATGSASEPALRATGRPTVRHLGELVERIERDTL